MEPGTRIGDYETIRLLGRGGMAEVWLARNPLMRGQFAVKFVLDQFAGNREIQERFRDEALRQSGLQHPNIAGIRTVLTEAGRVYIIMEYVESGLDKRLHALAGHPLPIPEAVDITLQLLDALNYTHSLPDGALIHRDIKPSNILLKPDNQIRLTDFGIALATNEARKTMTGQALGTAFYMSPEQIINPSAVDLRTDIYSTGCVLYEMLTGRPPFGKDGDTDYSIQHEHVNRMPDPLRKSNASIPERFEWIVLKALSKDPNYRFKSCREMAIALLGAYREEGLPVELLHSYHGGLTAPPVRPTQPPYIPTVIQPQQPIISTPPLGPITNPPVQAPPPLKTPPTRPPILPPPSKPWYKRPLPYLLLLLLAGAGAGAWYYFNGTSEGTVILRLEGSTSVGDKLAPALAAEYLSNHLHATDVKTDSVTSTAADKSTFTTFTVHGDVDGKTESIKIVSNGSGKAFSALEAKTADLGMSSRPFSSSDPADLSYLPSSNQYEHVIALDGIAVIVNASNHVQDLSLAQLRAIFTGNSSASFWSQVNGNGGRIHCYGRDSSSGTFEMFRNTVVGKTGVLSAIQKADQFAEGKDVVDHVAQDPNGIGYVTFTQATGVHVLAVSDLGTTALYPNPLTVSTEDYVLTRRLFLYQPVNATKTATDFIAFVMSQDGQTVVSVNNFVSLVPKYHNDPIPADAPYEYKSLVAGLRRLGLSFHFKSGSGSFKDSQVLDNLAQDNINRLKAYMIAHPDDQITLLGFADSDKSRNISNEQLSLNRANDVASELEKNEITAQVHGLGAAMPVATNSTPDGKAKNRRVEVWVRGTRATS